MNVTSFASTEEPTKNSKAQKSPDTGFAEEKRIIRRIFPDIFIIYLLLHFSISLG